MGTHRLLCISLLISLLVTCVSGSLLKDLLSGVHDHVHKVVNTVKHVIDGQAKIDYQQNKGDQRPPYLMHQGVQTPDVVNVVVVVKEEDNPGYEHYHHRPHHHHHGRLPHHGGNQGHGQYGYGNQNNQEHYHHGYGHQNGYGQGVNGGQQDYANQNKPGHGGQYGNGNNQGYGQQSGNGYNNNQTPVNNDNQEGCGNEHNGYGQNKQNDEQETPTHFGPMTTPNPGPSEQEKPHGFGRPPMLKPLEPVNTNGQKETMNQPGPDNDDPLHVALINPNGYSYGDKDTKEPKRETPKDDEEVSIDVRIGK